ncbi:hypothetical protein [Streptomyces bullii]|uniref:Uncharacterized protein n=1 Tax=Streptomyces bullii TaxID=349910 RepID=A0ABW0V0I1_9ACTN
MLANGGGGVLLAVRVQPHGGAGLLAHPHAEVPEQDLQLRHADLQTLRDVVGDDDEGVEGALEVLLPLRHRRVLQDVHACLGAGEEGGVVGHALVQPEGAVAVGREHYADEGLTDGLEQRRDVLVRDRAVAADGLLHVPVRLRLVPLLQGRGDQAQLDQAREERPGLPPLLGGVGLEGDDQMAAVVTPMALEDVALEVAQDGPHGLLRVAGRRDLDIGVDRRLFQIDCHTLLITPKRVKVIVPPCIPLAYARGNERAATCTDERHGKVCADQRHSLARSSVPRAPNPLLVVRCGR